MDRQKQGGGSTATHTRHKGAGRRKGEETYECMCFHAKELTHPKYLARPANRFACLGTTEYWEEKAKDKWPGERLEEWSTSVATRQSPLLRRFSGSVSSHNMQPLCPNNGDWIMKSYGGGGTWDG